MEPHHIEKTETPKSVAPEPSIYTLNPIDTSDDVTLELHEPALEDAPNALRRPISSDKEKEKSRWNWRGIFPITDTQPPLTPAHNVSSAAANVREADIIENLTELGLTPAAIVDDGCIIEAVNLRVAHDNATMSHAVAKRLSTPVRYLFQAIEKDPALKMDVRAFTEQFNARLAPIVADREALRKKLESNAGRAYLLCDASLNA